MYTLIETPVFSHDADKIWSEKEKDEFYEWLATHPNAGVLIPGSGGCRKLRWSRQGTGKRGGTRIIYYAKESEGQIWLLVIYSKSARDNIPTHLLKAIKEALDHE